MSALCCTALHSLTNAAPAAAPLVPCSLSKGGSFAAGTDTEAPGEHACNEARRCCLACLLPRACRPWRRPRTHPVPPSPPPPPAQCHPQCCCLAAACLPQILNHCYELLARCVRSAEDISPEMKARAALARLMLPAVVPARTSPRACFSAPAGRRARKHRLSHTAGRPPCLKTRRRCTTGCGAPRTRCASSPASG